MKTPTRPIRISQGGRCLTYIDTEGKEHPYKSHAVYLSELAEEISKEAKDILSWIECKRPCFNSSKAQPAGPVDQGHSKSVDVEK